MRAFKGWLSVLGEAEILLPTLLADRARWASLWVDYHEPYVERLWTDAVVGGERVRVFLHRIHPAPLGACLFHPHPWPSAMRVVSGSYAMRMGEGGSDGASPSTSCSMELAEGSAYEMSDPALWHAVSPLGAPSLSLMVTGRPYASAPGARKADKPLGPLAPAVADALFAEFVARYGVAPQPLA